MVLKKVCGVFLFVVFQVIIISFSWAQEAHPTFKHYDIEDGLPSSEVYQVKQDSKGFNWFATSNGVSRYNGYEFENFSMADGLPDNTILEIFEDNFDIVWFLSLSCKISYYQKGKIYLYKYNDKLSKLFKPNPLKTSFYVDSNETLFLGIRNDGVYEISKDGNIKHHFENTTPSISSLKSLEPDSGFFVYTTIRYLFSKQIEFTFDNATLKYTLKENIDVTYDNVRIIRLRNNKIAFCSSRNVYFINDKKEIEINAFSSRINWIYEDNENGFWVATVDGIYFIKDFDFENKQKYLNDNSVTGILQDMEGAFWITTEGNSVYYTPSKYFLTFDKSSGLNSEKTNCLAIEANNIYAGGQDGFIYKIKNDKIEEKINCTVDKVEVNSVNNIAYDPFEKKMWIAGKMKSGYLQNNHFILFPFSTYHDIIFEDGNVNWAACSSALVKSDKRLKDANCGIGKVFKRSNALLKKSSNNILLGTMDGLWNYDISTETYKEEGINFPQLRNRILDLAYTNDSTLVVATKGCGLLLYDENSLLQINTKKGLCGDNVLKLTIDSNIIWAATNMGLNRITIQKNNPFEYSIKSYTTNNGLASNEVVDLVKIDGKIYAATNKGLTYFNSNYQENNSFEIPLYINKILINENDTSIEKEYKLKYNENNIKINFIALSYKNAGKLKYRYKMIGLDNHWIYTNNREVQFTTLPADEYKFVLSCQNANGGWSKKFIQINFIIKEAFWNRWWFHLAETIITLALIIWLFKYRIKKVREEKEKNTELNKNLLKLKLKALRAQMNPHFTFNVMNSIQHYIINKDDLAANKYLSKFSKLIRTILNNSEENTILLSEEIKALELYLELEAMRFDNSFKYEISIDKNIDTNEIEIPSMLIQPYVENAIKHGILPIDTNGKVKIEIQKVDQFLKCTIEDNGIGRHKASEKRANVEYKSYGTSITQQRLTVINELYDSKLQEKITDLFNANGEAIGTKIEIYIPINIKKLP
jgi:ligand-binding sensor domain-containing protein